LIFILKISNLIITDLSWLVKAPEGLHNGSHQCHLVIFANDAPEGLSIGSMKNNGFKKGMP
jgi:hypothetical protein